MTASANSSRAIDCRLLATAGEIRPHVSTAPSARIARDSPSVSRIRLLTARFVVKPRTTSATANRASLVITWNETSVAGGTTLQQLAVLLERSDLRRGHLHGD